MRKTGTEKDRRKEKKNESQYMEVTRSRTQERERLRERHREIKGGKEGGVLAPAYTGPDVLRLKN